MKGYLFMEVDIGVDGIRNEPKHPGGDHFMTQQPLGGQA